MTQYEMAQKLAQKCEVTLEEAMAALEAGSWNALTATHILEQEKFRRMQEVNAAAEAAEAEAQAEEEPAAKAEAADGTADMDEAADEKAEADACAAPKKRCRGQGFRNLMAHVRRLVACGNRNRFSARKGEETVLDMPVTALVLLMLRAFWVCVPLLVIGLFAGCRYSFSGRDLGREDLNRALGKAADAADAMKKTVAQA